MRDLVRDLSLALREHVLPSLGSHAARAHDHDAEAAGGDVTFAIDAGAEALLEEFLAERAPDLAFYSEDRGLVMPPGAEAAAVLVVDPIDGTRPALAGLESCCVSVALAPLHGEPTMADVTHGCVVEIPSGRVFLAERGAGLVEGPPVRLSDNQRLDRMFWTYGFRGRPARALTEVMAELIDASSVGGGTFELGSAAFDMTPRRGPASWTPTWSRDRAWWPTCPACARSSSAWAAARCSTTHRTTSPPPHSCSGRRARS